jgi:adenosylcobinamide amidohydrolase
MKKKKEKKKKKKKVKSPYFYNWLRVQQVANRSIPRGYACDNRRKRDHHKSTRSKWEAESLAVVKAAGRYSREKQRGVSQGVWPCHFHFKVS